MIKKINLAMALIAVLILSFGSLAMAHQQVQPAFQGNAPGMGNRGVFTRFRRERHPELMAGLRALEKARAELQSGAHDFNGHRARL